MSEPEPPLMRVWFVCPLCSKMASATLPMLHNITAVPMCAKGHAPLSVNIEWPVARRRVGV